MLFMMFIACGSPLYRTPPVSQPPTVPHHQTVYVYEYVDPVQGALDTISFGLTAVPPKKLVKTK